MKTILARIEEAEKYYQEQIAKERKGKPYVRINIDSILLDKVFIEKYDHKGHKELLLETDLDGMVIWIYKNALSIETYVSLSKCIEYLFADLLLADAEENFSGKEEAKQQTINRWLQKYPILNLKKNDLIWAENLQRIKPTSNVSEIIRERIKESNRQGI